jgi:hypothetical protein
MRTLFVLFLFACGSNPSGTTGPAPAMAGAGQVGAACAADGDCTQMSAGCITPNTNSTWPAGYCTVKGCPATACPDGTTCQMGSTMVGAICMYKCESDANCRTGYKCCAITMPAGTGLKACMPPINGLCQ